MTALHVQAVTTALVISVSSSGLYLSCFRPHLIFLSFVVLGNCPKSKYNKRRRCFSTHFGQKRTQVIPIELQTVGQTSERAEDSGPHRFRVSLPVRADSHLSKAWNPSAATNSQPSLSKIFQKGLSWNGMAIMWSDIWVPFMSLPLIQQGNKIKKLVSSFLWIPKLIHIHGRSFQKIPD